MVEVMLCKYLGTIITLNGTCEGISVQEVVDSFQKVNDLKICYKIVPRRAGDV